MPEPDVMEIRLGRRMPLGGDAEPGVVGPCQPTAAGFRLPLAVAPALAEAITRTIRRAAAAELWRAPAPDPGDHAA